MEKSNKKAYRHAHPSLCRMQSGNWRNDQNYTGTTVLETALERSELEHLSFDAIRNQWSSKKISYKANTNWMIVKRLFWLHGIVDIKLIYIEDIQPDVLSCLKYLATIGNAIAFQRIPFSTIYLVFEWLPSFLQLLFNVIKIYFLPSHIFQPYW